MNPIRALLWKEGREAAYKTAAGAGLALFVGLAYLVPDFSLRFPLTSTSRLVGFLGAVLMGIGVVAGERSLGTLQFLLSRPLGLVRLLGVKFAVGAAGLLAVLAAYWGGVYLGMLKWGDYNFLLKNFMGPPDGAYPVLWEIRAGVGYGRMLLLWFFPYSILYTAVFLASAFTDHPLKAAITGLMVAWVGLFFLESVWILGPHMARFYFGLVFSSGMDQSAGILRHAFDPYLLLTRAATAALLAGGALLWACRAFRVQASKRFQWTVGGLALTCGVIVIGLVAVESSHRRGPIVPVEPVGRLPFATRITDLALKDELAVVLLERGISVVDVGAPQAPAEIGRWEIAGWQLERLALSGSTAYVWGEAQDSVGVAVFDLSQPEHPRLQAQRLLYPFEQGPGPWLRRIPRLVGWGVWNGHLYAGLLRNDFLELHSFDVRDGGLPRRIQVLPIEEAAKHAWNNGWEMRIVGPHAFLVLGHDFVVLDLADPARPEVLSRTPLRRFGRSIHYEKLVQEFRQKLTSSRPWLRVTQMDSAGSKTLRRRLLDTDGLSSYTASAPPALGPLTVGNGRAYIERHLPREIAVVDISDPRKPIEVDYIPWMPMPRQFTIEGESAYALTRGAIQTYAKTGYGAFSRREKLGRFADYKKYSRNVDIFDFKAQGADPLRDMFILKGEHIYALLNNNLAIFETPSRTK